MTHGDEFWRKRTAASQGAYEIPPLEREGEQKPERPRKYKRWSELDFLSKAFLVFLVGWSCAIVLGGVAGLVSAMAAFRDEPSTTSAAAATSRSLLPPVTTTTKPPSTTAPVHPGHQGVAVPARGIAYDVPAGWQVDNADTIRGFETEAGRVTGTGGAVDGPNYCGAELRTVSYVSRSKAPDLATAATDFATDAAELGYAGSNWAQQSIGPVPLTTATGITGQMVEVTGPRTPKDPTCPGAEFSVYTFAFAGPDNPILVLTLAADRGVPGELTPAQAREIFTTVRLLE
ncbi:hypothetical protein [Nocardia farcinica]|uniref:DUF8017 domain-containing protein n=1 Tax=Nocardia farcinica (strain IFM 10152) TaxID=247156 RepID=Q5Z2N1_NOCFA|nr:hypothetical protein [Nocardia farcinica]BAD55310.1 hypothetical protein NFA_4680 [Nocardia farcinica IFM 10152]